MWKPIIAQLLPTTGEARLFNCSYSNNVNTLSGFEKDGCCNPVDLYILIDEVIPYVPNGGTSGIFLCLDELDHPDDAIVKNVGSCGGCRTILATTNKELNNKGVPNISDAFLEEWSKTPKANISIEYTQHQILKDYGKKVLGVNVDAFSLQVNEDKTVNLRVDGDWSALVTAFEEDVQVDKGIYTYRDFAEWLKKSCNAPTFKS